MQTPTNTDVPKQSAQPPTKKPPWYRRTIRLSGQIVLLSLAIGGLTLLWLLVRPNSQQAPTSTAQVATVTPQPTAAPSPTAQTVTVGGYTFGLPQAVPDLTGYTTLVGWLSNSPTEVVDVHANQAIAIDVFTGKKRPLGPKHSLGITPRRVMLLADGYIAYVTHNQELNVSADLWISRDWTNRQILHSAFQKPGYGWVMAPNQKQILVYDRTTFQSQLVGSNGTVERASPHYQKILAPLKLTKDVQVLEKEQDWRRLLAQGYDSTSSLNSRWTVFDKEKQFYLIDLKTGEEKNFQLPLPKQAMTRRWSPDGQKLALLVSQEIHDPIRYLELVVYDVTTERLQKIETEFDYITNVTWAPDSQQLLLSAQVGSYYDPVLGDEYKKSDLFLVDTITNRVELVPLLPDGSSIDFLWQLFWSPNGQTIVLGAMIPEGQGKYIISPLHRIDVITP